MISGHISNDIPPQMKNLHMVIPILIVPQSHLKLECCKPYKATHPQTRVDNNCHEWQEKVKHSE